MATFFLENLNLVALVGSVGERQSAVLGVESSCRRRTNTQGLKLTEENVLPL